MYKWGGPRPYPAFVLFCLNKKARFAVVAGVHLIWGAPC